ncbi:chemotaxis protein CheW [Roseococcus sp. YIM B11640]|uniref:chemotaxis protein CheW n=1 Tax=Roseococcus sp. YIM B11640 TaxID=3133973 RepID=UPI003C7A9939
MERESQRLTVRAGQAQVALPASQIAEVIRRPRITRVPNAPPVLLGVTHLRGTVLPVVSLRGLLEGEGAAATAEQIVVLRHDPLVALAVDAIQALRSVQTDKAEPGDRVLVGEEDGGRWLDLGSVLRERLGAFRGQDRGLPARREARTTDAAADLAFLAFALSGQDYGLPLDAVAEVLALPASLTALPHSEDVLLGVFPWRDRILPALSLRRLLGLPTRAPTSADRVIVARVGGHLLALVVDRVDTILRAPRERLSPAPSLFNKAGGEARIDLVLRLADERGLVSILAPERVLADERVAKLLGATEQNKDEAVARSASSSQRERFLVIRLGPEAYALALEAVDEVVRMPATPTRLPKAPAYVRGVMNLRGRVIPLIDQRRRFAVEGESSGGRVVVLTIGPLQAGFVVDAASEILEVEAEDLMPAPDLSEGGHPLFRRAARLDREGEVVLVIDPAVLLDRAEADLLSDLASSSRDP